MNFLVKWFRRWRNRRKAGDLLDQAGRLDLRKQELEKDRRRHHQRMDELRQAAETAQKEGNTGRLDDLLADMKELDGKLRNTNFLLNNLDRKRDKIMKAVQIIQTATDDVFSAEDIDFDIIEDLDAEIAVRSEDLDRDARRTDRLQATVSDTRERFSDSQRNELLRQFDMEPDGQVAEQEVPASKRVAKDDAEHAEKLFDESIEPIRETDEGEKTQS
ncbi:hypothetical protein JW777_10015 [bacterium]|nr:hypothetical protein [bacterium]